MSGTADYFTHRAAGSPEGGPADALWPDLWENLAPVQRVGYLTDLLSDRAVQFIGRKRSAPFLLNLHYTAPHSPWEGPEDAAIGRALTACGVAGLERNRLVIFTSGHRGERFSYN